MDSENHDSDSQDRKQGELYGECYPNKTCNEGLECDVENNTCVKENTNNNDSTSDDDTDSSDSGDSQSDDSDSSDSTDDADSSDSGDSQSDDSDSSDSTDDADSSDSGNDSGDSGSDDDADSDSGDSSADVDSDTTFDVPECSQTSGTTPCKDPETDLIWSEKFQSVLTLDAAVEYCDLLEDGGYKDWRLPNIDELRTLIVNYHTEKEFSGICPVSESDNKLSTHDKTDSCTRSVTFVDISCLWNLRETWWNPPINGYYSTSKFNDFRVINNMHYPIKFWSSSVVSDNAFSAWYVQFRLLQNQGAIEEDVVNYQAKTDSAYVRCVRGHMNESTKKCKGGDGVWNEEQNVCQRKIQCTAIDEYRKWNEQCYFEQKYVGGEWIGDVQNQYDEEAGICHFTCKENYLYLGNSFFWNGEECVTPCKNDSCQHLANSICSAQSVTAFDCICKENYSFTDNQCVANTREEACSGLIENAQWNSVSTISQIWDGTNWQPPMTDSSYNTIESTSECRYKCMQGYVWDGSACKSASTVILPECTPSSSIPCKDSSSALTWSEKAPLTMTWSQAVSYCDELSEGYSNWRLPTISELRTLIQNCDNLNMPNGTCGVRDDSIVCLSDNCQTSCTCFCEENTYNKLGERGSLWSSSVHPDYSWAWYMSFNCGKVALDIQDHGYSVRCVRK